MKTVILTCLMCLGVKGWYVETAKTYATKLGMSPDQTKHFLAIGQVESGYQNIAEAKAAPESHGIFQIMLPTGKWRCPSLIKKLKDLYEPDKNIECAARIFKEELDQYGDVTKAIAAYNAGRPIYCKKTGEFVGRNGYRANCVKGWLLNHKYVSDVKAAAVAALWEEFYVSDAYRAVPIAL